MNALYSDAEWGKITGPGATFITAATVEDAARSGARVYGLHGSAIVRVHTLESALECSRVWITGTNSLPIGKG